MFASWKLPMSTPPRPRAIALGRHGPGRLTYRLHGLWQVHLYPYATSAVIGGVRLDIRPGCAGVTPPDAVMEYELARPSAHVYAHFAVTAGPPIDAPALVDLGRSYARTEAALLEAAGWVQQAPDRAAARLWDVLWQVVAAAPAAPGQDLVARARDVIEARLPAAIDIGHLAHQLGCTHAHLTRSFRTRLDTTVIAYVRHRRVERAAHLLRSSSLPISEVARQVGVADLHAFNKLLRRELGSAPRAVRQKGKSDSPHSHYR